MKKFLTVALMSTIVLLASCGGEKSAATGGGAKVTTTVTDTDSQYAAGDFIIKSNNSCLSIAPDANDISGKTIAVSLDWGSF